ncbi:VanZ family protein [Stieleria sp. TO1_6]|uniref:VanZ family protein n=1 Tax=Stieleria tagensis TaxID=2956795 RepID=UPI00209AFDDD|nr:VanZ family protein [Stieleria tagensis]MCO8124860.1 VanZ family protein [Stieleria tagensis]
MRPITGITILGFRLGVIALVGYWITLFLGTHWPAGAEIVPDVSDKVKHFSAFFGLALLCCYVSESPRSDHAATVRRFGMIVVGLMIYAVIDELTQFFSPGRHPDPLDALADTGGIVSAVILYLIARRWIRHRI